ENSAKVANMARILAIVHIIVGCLLLCLGFIERFPYGLLWTSWLGLGIWIGAWVIITGCLGIPGTRKERSTRRNTFAGTYMGFCITSVMMSGGIISCYSFNIEHLDTYDEEDSSVKRTAVVWIFLMLGIVECLIGIWAAVCCCLMRPCCKSVPLQQGQVMYTANAGFVMTQDPGTCNAMQADRGMVAVATLTPGSQGGKPQMVLVPIFGVQGYQPQLAQVAPDVAMATGYQHQQVEMPPPYELVDYNVVNRSQ
ncbi:hypothetical protein ACROYT_G029898, partial [Oculina patagonica]